MGSVAMRALARVHGGPDALGPAALDLSTCAHPAGPDPLAWAAVQAADPRHYPDPQHTALREALAALHGVAPSRLLFAASASEFIQRISAVAARCGPSPRVAAPPLAYGDYAWAAQAWGLVSPGQQPGPATLRWCADPSSPLGQAEGPPTDGATATVLDRAYAPLRLVGPSRWSPAALDTVFQLFSPNKVLALCGVRGAYVVAPRKAHPWQAALEAAAPSWPLGAHAVALLQAWATPAVQAAQAERLRRVRPWRAALEAGLRARGFQPLPSVTPFLCAAVPDGVSAAALRRHGVAVRDTDSFGLPGHWRINCAPQLDLLWRALDEVLSCAP
jgi:histidinol-phosphate aminotransferase